MSRYEPIQVTVKFLSPMLVPAHPVTLDGLLSGLLVRKLEDEGHNEPWSKQHDLPLDKYTSPSGEWVFKASQFRGKRQMEPFQSMMTSRINKVMAVQDIEDGLLPFRGSSLPTDGGAFKSVLDRSIMQWVDSMTAFGFGDVDKVSDLLQTMSYFGGKRATGAGQVDCVTVEPIHEDDCRWYHRPLPKDFDQSAGITFVPAVGTLRAPYWKRENGQEILVPLYD